MASKRQRDPALIYNKAEAARRIHPDLSPHTMDRWRRQGTGPRFVRAGRRIGYTEEALVEWIEHQSRRSTAEK
jgi:hypothetical protein